MALYTIADTKEFAAKNEIQDIEIYKFNSIKKSVHTDYVNFIDFGFAGLTDDTEVHSYDLMDYEDYSHSIEANGSGAFNEDEFNREYPNGILVVVLPY